MKIRALSLLMAFVILCSLLPLSVFAAEPTSGKCGENVYWEFDEATGTLTISGTGDMDDELTEEVIWATPNFEVHHVMIEDGVTSIGNGAFFGCFYLESVSIPESVEYIGNNSFYGCESLKEVDLPLSLKSINPGVFYECRSLQKIKIPDGVESIGNSAFYACAITSIDIPDSVTSIGGLAFYDCKKLKTVNLPKDLKEISIMTFLNCNRLESIVIPDRVTKIGSMAFSGCYLQSVVIPDSVKTIHDDVFYGIGTIYYTGSEQQWNSIEIDKYNSALFGATLVFNYDSGVNETPYSGQCGDNAYWEYDESTKTLTISGTGDMWDYELFITGTQPWYECDPIDHVAIKEGITSIGQSAFMEYGLKTITIADGVKAIGNRAFYSCSSLRGVIFPDSVTSIGNGAFEYCFALENVKLSKQLTSIDEGAFFWCSGLTIMEFPDGMTSIGCSAFYNCEELENVTLPDSLSFIGSNAFDGCESLSEVYYTGSKEQWWDIEIGGGNEPLTRLTPVFNYGQKHDYRLVLSPENESLTVTTGETAEIVCSLYDGDTLVTDWNVSGLSFSYSSNGGVPCTEYVRTEKHELGNAVIVNALAVGTVNMILKDEKTGTEGHFTFEVVSDIGNAQERSDWVKQHAEYAASEVYQKDIQPGYTGYMSEVFDKAQKDLGIKAYDFADCLDNLDFSVSQSEMYELMLMELMYASLYEDGAMVDLYREKLRNATYKNLKSTYDALKLKGIAEDTLELYDRYLKVLNTAEYASKGYEDAYDACLGLIVEEFDAFDDFDDFCKALKNNALGYGVDLAVDLVVDSVDTTIGRIEKTLAYSNNSVAYAMASDDFRNVIDALEKKITRDFTAESFPALSEKDQAMNWEDLAIALRQFSNELDKCKSDRAAAVAEYALECYETSNSEFVNEAIQNIGKDAALELLKCFPVTNVVYYAYKAICGGKLVMELLTDIEEQSYRMDIMTKCYCISVALDSVADDFAKGMVESFMLTSSFDETICLYKAIQLQALTYMQQYVCSNIDFLSGSKYNPNRLTQMHMATKQLNGVANYYRMISCHDSSWISVNDMYNKVYIDGTMYAAACPVAMVVTSDTGEQVAYLSDDKCEVAQGYRNYCYIVEMEDGEMLKVANVPNSYQVEIIGLDNGLMNAYTLKETETGKYEVQAFENVVVHEGMEASFKNEEQSEEKILVVDGEEVNGEVVDLTKNEPITNPFSDVKDSDWFYNSVMWAYENNVTGGTSATTFGPNDSCTRAQVVTFLWAANGKPEPKLALNPFDDVKESDWYYKPVLWAVENGITGGVSKNLFGPNQTCTRAQIVTFLYAAVDKPAVIGNSDFKDVADTDWFAKPVIWAAQNEVTGGIGDGKFGPNNTCTRGQVVTFLYKVYGVTTQ